MTDPSRLLAEAQAISGSAAAIKKFAIDAANNIVDQDLRLKDQATKIADLTKRLTAVEAIVTPPGPTPLPSLPVPVKALIFSEDFSAPLDLTRWDVKSRPSDSGTIFDANHYRVANGVLDIWADKDAAGVWHSAEIQMLAAYAYTGPRYVEVDAKLPVGYGTWPAPLWEWNAPWGAIGPTHCENDVVEQLGREPGKYHFTVHDSTGKGYGKVIDTGVDFSAASHTFSTAVYADRIDAYFDRVLKATITKAEALAAGLIDWHFVDTPMVALCDLDMGGSWAGTPTIAGPVHMLVDYIRVWAL